jgi:hypothetical protein
MTRHDTMMIPPTTIQTLIVEETAAGRQQAPPRPFSYLFRVDKRWPVFINAQFCKMEQRIDDEECAAAEAQGGKQDRGYCLSCRQSIADEEVEDHKGCPIRLLSSMVADAKKEHAGWKELQGEAAALIQNESRRIDDAAASAIEIASKVIRTKAEELKKEVQNSCSQKSLSRILQSQAEHLERLAELCAFDDADSTNFEQSIHRAASSVPYPSPKSCGIFYPAIAEVAAICKFVMLGRVVGSLDNDKASEL